MIGDHLQHQSADFAAVAHETEQQAVGVIEPGPIKLAMGGAGTLLHLRCAEILAGNRFLDFVIARLDATTTSISSTLTSSLL